MSVAIAQDKGEPDGTSSSAQSQLDLSRPDGVADLNSHLARLAENPRDVNALIGAGEAALALNDPRAATGFFARADEIESGNGRIKAGLGRAMVEMRNPGEALRLFDQATRLGYPDASFVGDRGLAKDLTGDPKGAQQDYMAALRNTPNDTDLTLKLAVSLGISGDVDGAEKLLKPLLYKSDRAAWRDRAFIMAMNGRRDEARDITTKTMPKALSDAIQPYMDKMAALNPAQRAAAVHFGVFPTDANIKMAARSPAPAQPAPAPATPPPAETVAKAPVRETAAEARARKKAEKEALLQRQAAERVAAREAEEREKQAQVAAAMQRKPEPTKPAQTTLAQAAPAPAKPAPVVPAPQRQQPSAEASRAPVASPQVQGPPAPAPGFSTAIASAPEPAPPSPPPPPQAAAPAPNPQATRTLADIMRELKVPEEERRVDVNAVKLADLEAIQAERRRTAAAKAKADAAAKAKAAAAEQAKAEAAEKARLAKNPSRNWVQVGTGRDLSAVAFTMKGLRKKYDLLAKKDAYTASWGKTNRLVVGPFSSFTKAKDFEAELKKAGTDAFAWQSDAGEEVDALAK